MKFRLKFSTTTNNTVVREAELVGVEADNIPNAIYQAKQILQTKIAVPVASMPGSGRCGEQRTVEVEWTCVAAEQEPQEWSAANGGSEAGTREWFPWVRR